MIDPLVCTLAGKSVALVVLQLSLRRWRSTSEESDFSRAKTCPIALLVK